MEKPHDNFKTHLLNDTGKAKARAIGEEFSKLLDFCDQSGVDGRFRALVATKLEEACFFAKKAVAVKPENQES